jgi:hypothetical protein
MPRCSACFRANHPSCVVAEGSSRCEFCISKKYSGCDFGGVSSQAFARVSQEKDRLDEEKEKAEADLLEALSRLQRLRRQEKHLREKAAEMVRRGCEDLDELERAEAAEVAQSQEAALSEVQVLEDNGVIDWSSLVDPQAPEFGVIFSSFAPGGASSGTV